MNKVVSALLFSVLVVCPIYGQENYKDVHPVSEVINSNYHSPAISTTVNVRSSARPKNIILLIGDGMGIAHVCAAYTANKGALNITSMPYSGFSITHSANDYITDSAAGGTALACGVKTKNGSIGVDANGNPVKSILEMAEENGKATGLVATTAITHATPASFIAHVGSRASYEAIATFFVQTNIDLFIGGGRSHFEERKDKRNLTDELKNKGYTIEYSMDKAMQANRLPLAVLTASQHIPQYSERLDMLPNATQKALSLLSQDKDGFFVMIEGSHIDWGGHSNDILKVVDEMLDFDRAVGKALEFAQKDKNTLVIVTADHETGGLTILGGNNSTGSLSAGFSSPNHTGVMVPVFAYGPGAQLFTGVYENTEVFTKMTSLMRLVRLPRR
jgi:alkaline phosphatase